MMLTILKQCWTQFIKCIPNSGNPIMRKKGKKNNFYLEKRLILLNFKTFFAFENTCYSSWNEKIIKGGGGCNDYCHRKSIYFFHYFSRGPNSWVDYAL